MRFGWFLLTVWGAFVLAIVYTFQRLAISQLGFNELVAIHFQDALGTTFGSVFSSYQLQQ